MEDHRLRRGFVYLGSGPWFENRWLDIMWRIRAKWLGVKVVRRRF